MQRNIIEQNKIQTPRPLRAIVELRDGELYVYPIAGSDADRNLDGLRFLLDEQRAA